MSGKRGTKRSVTEDSALPRGRPPKRRATGQGKAPQRAQQHPHGNVDSQAEYKARSIIAETGNKYRIDWEPDSQTGQLYTPTWEPKQNANEALIEDWEKQKAAKREQESTLANSSNYSAPAPAPPPKKRGRASRKIVESSPAPPTTQDKDTTVGSQQPDVAAGVEPEVLTTRATDAEPEIGPSQQTEGGAEQATKHKAFVAAPSPPSSFLAGEYQRFNSRPTSEDESEPVQAPEVFESSAPEENTEQHPTAQSTQKSTNDTSLVIPESQSQSQSQALLEDSTFRGFSPTQTQQAAATQESEDPDQVAGASEEQPDEPVTGASSRHPNQDAETNLQPSAQSDQTQPGEQISADPLSESYDQESRNDQAHSIEGASSIEQPNHQSVAAPAVADERSQSQALDHAHGPGDQGRPNGTAAPSEAGTKSSLSLTFGQPTIDSEPRNNRADKDQAITIASAEHTSDQSWLNFDSSIRPADFVPPPAGQRLPPSSLPSLPENNNRVSQATTDPPFTQHQSHNTPPFETPAGLTPSQPIVQTEITHYHDHGPSQSSVGFLTQIPQQANSTPFPSIPSHSLGPVGESAPQPIATSSGTSRMDASPMERPDTLEERLRRRREERAIERERRAAERKSTTPAPPAFANGSAFGNGQPASALPPNVVNRLSSPLASAHERSPSTVPAVEAVAPLTREEMTTSGRYETLLPKQAHNEAAVHVNSILGSAALQPRVITDPETTGIHLVPVAPAPPQRDQYQNNIYFDRELIAEVRKEDSVGGDLLKRANAFLQRLRNTAMHPDLISPETLSQKAENEVQARWDISCSAKFAFLNEFIANLSDQNLHIAVVAHGDRIPTILQNFLQGIKVPCKRWARPTPEDPDLSETNLGLKFSIVDLDVETQGVQPADVVIAVDPLVDHQHPLVRAVRKKTSEENAKWAMLLVLVLPRTIEHLEKCLQADMSPAARTKLLVKLTHETRAEAGRLESTQATIRDAASAIANFLEDTTAEWPIAGLSQLEELDSQTETDIQADSHGVKRPLDQMETDTDSDTAAKRLRQTPAPVEGTINPFDLDITHVSNSLEKGTAEALGSDTASQTATEQKLRELLQNMQERLDEHVKALEDLQYRYEDQRRGLLEVKKQRDGAIITAERAAARMTSVEADNTALRTERTQLKEALGEARQQLLNHTIPEVRELEELRMQVQQSKTKEEKAVKKAAATEQDVEWIRSQYQEASNQVRDLRQNNKELEQSLEKANTIAKGEQARARQASAQGHNKILEQETKKLRSMVENMKVAMKNKDEQLALLREGRGRIGTRQSSVPRSPRMGSPMKGRMSRQGSPAASGEARGRGALLHPLRNSAGG
ncbi:hypothetical protein CERZMDRAFT_101241 [Cercospora zeae-maydis SCOH1-5]|uniref:Chromo domain-containing protein n=1 Tax=Cercospora zeae-maydis SCOH1-5 TaxID=717836 RepID=A0A6A6F790_9PEZI|nr:hypothetical protein CERZMDRAFT_101241 [Cercospora zeae-maydis SCOH1-5]